MIAIKTEQQIDCLLGYLEREGYQGPQIFDDDRTLSEWAPMMKSDLRKHGLIVVQMSNVMDPDTLERRRRVVWNIPEAPEKFLGSRYERWMESYDRMLETAKK